MKIAPEVISKIINREIFQLIYNKFSLVIIFENGELTIESNYKYINSIGQSEFNEFPLKKQDNLISIIGNTIKSVDLQENNALNIEFSNGSKIEISSNEGKFESYSLSIDGELYVAN